MRHYIYLLLGVSILGCVLEEADKASEISPIYAISTDQNTVSRRVFDQCVLQYSFQNSPRALDVTTILKQLELPFDRWAQANGYLGFERVSVKDSAEVSFIFVDHLPLKEPQNYSTFGLIGQPVSGLSQLVRRANGNCTIYLLNSHAWNPADLQRVLLFQIGAALGLANSSRSTSAMWPQLNNTTQPDSLDAKAIQQLYNQPCDRWTRLADLPFDSRFVETSVANTTRGYVFLGASRNASWEFNPATKGWTSRLTHPTSLYQSVYNNSWLSFAIDSTIFIGEIYNGSWQAGQKGAFWRYVPSENTNGERWIKLDSIPQVGWGSAYGFTINKTLYVLTRNKVNGGSAVSVNAYDPLINKWTKPSILNEPTGFDIFYMAPFVLGTDAYLVRAYSVFYKSWRFNPNQASVFAESPSFNGGDSYITVFSVRNAGYGISGGYNSPKSVWQYKPEQGWKQMNNLPAQGPLAFSFTIGNRAYVGTTTDQFWEYRP